MSAEQEAVEPIASDNSSLKLIPNEDNTAFAHVNEKKTAWLDFTDSIKKWPIWLMLAYQDIKLRYRRSILGPFWLTLSMAITVYSMGYLYSHLFHIDLNEYFPYLVAGMLAWSLLSTTLTDLVDAFASSDNMIKQIKLPYFLYIHRVIARNILIFFHNILVIIPVLIFFHGSTKINLCLLFLIPGLLLIYFNAICYGIVFAMIGVRYRDIPQIIKSLVQIIFFMTPIMWKPDILPESKRFIATCNPFYSFVELIRAPLTGHLPSLMNFEIVLLTTFIGIVGSYYMFIARRSRIIYWL